MVTGAGGGFSAGGDIQQLRDRLDDGTTPEESGADLEPGTSAAIERVASGPTAALRCVKRRLSEGFDKSLDRR